jgi:NADPH2:quinone reductase
MQTQALVCRHHGLPDQLDLVSDWAVPELGEHEVLIRVKAAGLNFPDVLIIQGKYQFQPEMPFVPGGECAGVVEAVGSGVTRWSPGDEVVQMGMSGAFAGHIVAHEMAILPKPKALNFTQAAGIGITYFTTYHALVQRAQVQPGETLLVLGAAGGVGSTAVELGKALGARVIAAASSEEKLALCRELGADEVINYSEESLKDRLKALTDGRGVDVVYDPVGGDFSEVALRSMAWNGRFLVIGFASGPIPSIPLNLTLLKGCAVIGVFWGRFIGEEPQVQQANVDALWAMFESEQLKPVITDVYPIASFQEGYAAMMERRALGKVIFTFDA